MGVGERPRHPGAGLDLVEALGDGPQRNRVPVALRPLLPARRALHRVHAEPRAAPSGASRRAREPTDRRGDRGGTDFQLAAVWEGDRHDERRLHRQKNARARLCPICVVSDDIAAAPAPAPTVDLVDELLLSVLAGIPQPATLTAIQAQLRRRGKRIGSVHGRLELLALRRRVSKTWLLGDIAWAVVSPVTTVSTEEHWAGRGTPA